MSRSITTILVANRGEIANRILRASRGLGLRTVAVCSDPDRDEPFAREADLTVPLGGTTAAESYLDVDLVIEAARRAGADAVHPGYGFLSESADAARRVAEAGFVWIGPPADVIAAMGDKLEAKRLAVEAGVPTLPSAELVGDAEFEWRAQAAAVGYPLLVKAAAGGGGKGMRSVLDEEALADAVATARREAAASFGDPTVFAERQLPRARHVEVQVAADSHGSTVHLGERECSIQRRHQKIVEEAPSPAVDPALRARLGAAAVALAEAAGYRTVGTVEFLVDDASRDFFFLEMNTRLQVEHPVTEEVTGVDLVELQIALAAGGPLPFRQDDLTLTGHAIEARLYAEDPASGWLPSAGPIHRYGHEPRPGLRYEDGVATGSVVTPFYDPLLAKVIARGPDRATAAARLAGALDALVVDGVATNRACLAAILREPDFLAGATTTTFVDDHPSVLHAGPDDEARMRHVAASVLAARSRRRAADRHWPFAPAGWRNVGPRRQHVELAIGGPDGDVLEVTYAVTDDDRFSVAAGGTEVEGRLVDVRVAGDGDGAGDGHRRRRRRRRPSRAPGVRRGDPPLRRPRRRHHLLRPVRRRPERPDRAAPVHRSVARGGGWGPDRAGARPGGRRRGRGRRRGDTRSDPGDHGGHEGGAPCHVPRRRGGGRGPRGRGRQRRRPPAARPDRGAPVTDPRPRTDAVRIANCSGFYGDRLSAAREMVEGGPIDVLTGDWLAELTMLILAKDRQRNPGGGFAKTFLVQLEEVLGRCLDDGVRIVGNAGGLNPSGCADAVLALADRLGLSPAVAHVEGDDLLPRLDDLRAAGVDLANMDTGERLEDLGVEPLTANAYLGGWGVREALARGADVVITGRVTDAAVVVGAAAHHHGWARTDWDALAGAVVAGHVIECGAQTTGGNYAFFEEVPGLDHPGFPLAEIAADGSSVVTKHPGTGGLVSTGTVTAQLLYEIQGLDYANPDAVVDLTSIRLEAAGPDRVRIHGVRGRPAPDRAKVAVNYLGGWRNSMTFVLTGLDIDAKAALAERTLWSLVPGGREAFAEVDVLLRRTDRDDPATNDEALAELRVTVMDADRDKVGRAFSNKVIEMVLASYPGLFTSSPPTDATSFGVYWPALVPVDVVPHEVVLGEQRVEVPPAPTGDVVHDAPPPVEPGHDDRWADAPTTRAPFGRVVGARSGDKGGNANLGVWARSDEAWSWLQWFLTEERVRELMPVETDGLEVRRYELPNLRAVNLVIVGLLGRGVAASTRTDPQAKGLGEYLRAKLVDVPAGLLEGQG